MEYHQRKLEKYPGDRVDAVQEVAFVLTLAAITSRLLGRGLAIDAFAPRMAFFSAVQMDLFEEVAKFRAMRRYGHEF